MIGGIERCDQGEIIVDGIDITSNKKMMGFSEVKFHFCFKTLY